MLGGHGLLGQNVNAMQKGFFKSEMFIAADEALKAAKRMPYGPDRVDAVERAGRLRNLAVKEEIKKTAILTKTETFPVLDKRRYL